MSLIVNVGGNEICTPFTIHWLGTHNSDHVTYYGRIPQLGDGICKLNLSSSLNNHAYCTSAVGLSNSTTLWVTRHHSSGKTTL